MRPSTTLRLALALLSLSAACGRAPGDGQVARPSNAAVTPPASAFARSTVDECADENTVNVVHHAVDLVARLDPPSLSGRADLQLKTRRTTRSIILDARGLRIQATASGTRSLPFRQARDRVCVEWPEPLSEGVEITLRIAWEVPTTGKTPLFSADQAWAGYTASAWMPTVQDSRERATLALRITADASLKVAASGREVGTALEHDGVRDHSFVLQRPSPPFLYAFAIGRFDEAALDVDGVNFRALGPAGSNLEGVLTMTKAMYRFMKDRTGAPLPSTRYTQVLVNGDAAQEAAGLALLSADALDDIRKDPSDDWLFAHELSHQWFGWLVPCVDFSDFWLNEGFATFLAAAFKEQRWGRNAYDKEVEVWRARSAKVHEGGRDAPLSLSLPGQPERPPPRDSELQARGVTYYRGALVLRKMRGELGETAFWAAIQRYVKDRAGRGARSEDLRAALEATSGRDWKAFFAKWVYAAAPDL